MSEAARVIEEIADPDANIIWGMTFDESYEGEVKVTIIATSFPPEAQQQMVAGQSSSNSGYGSAR